jgi:hypothetical protein
LASNTRLGGIWWAVARETQHQRKMSAAHFGRRWCGAEQERAEEEELARRGKIARGGRERGGGARGRGARGRRRGAADPQDSTEVFPTAIL